MEGIKCCAIKDIKETLRTGKLVLFFALAFGIAVMIMFFSVFFDIRLIFNVTFFVHLWPEILYITIKIRLYHFPIH